MGRRKRMSRKRVSRRGKKALWDAESLADVKKSLGIR